MAGECFDVAPPGLGHLIMLISGGLHPRLHDVAAPRLEKRNFKKRKRGPRSLQISQRPCSRFG
jgi:hypothetical protein